MTLFDDGRTLTEPAPVAPLAARVRPRTLDEVVGHRGLLGPGGALRRIAENDSATSLILVGPPGSGKTTIAHLLASERRYRELSAVNATVKDVRAVIDDARGALSAGGSRTLLFLDEVHRFSKAQQDVLLPAVENGWLALVAATTENPFFSVISPLLSRSLLLRLEPLSDDEVREVLRRALADPRGYGGRLSLTPEAADHLVTLAGGDARRALTSLEAAGLEEGVLDLATLERAVDRAAVRYDRDGDQHYDVTSAFIKSMRGGDVTAALHYLARMIEAGEDPRFIVRRIIILASEDIGMADPTALQVAVAAAQALELIGLPEARLNLAQAVIHCTLAPKSNAVISAYERAAADVRAGLTGPVPRHLRDAHYPGAARLGSRKGYQYPHDFPGGIVQQQYAPDGVAGKLYYEPTAREPKAAARAAEYRRALGLDAGGAAEGAEEWRPRCNPEKPD